MIYTVAYYHFPLSLIINSSLATGNVPNDLILAKVIHVPLFKAF